ncbi:hypothetical protein [Streptomyces sp. BA2]|uniref:hypothetical protein n=1 Tax=Streptomyces sp. BA2 TaxID=436595 RepID=UPI00192138B0|nr:hypothetical protein [Streptomyces sp. BA2]
MESEASEASDAGDVSEVSEPSASEWKRIRGGLRFGQVFTGTVVRVPKPGAIGLFVDIGLPVGGFVDVLLLPTAAETWPAEGTVTRFEVWWAAPERMQIRLKPLEPAYLNEDFDELVTSLRPAWPSLVGQPMDYMEQMIETLEREFRAEDGSFLLRLRSDLTWDRSAFTRLERAMRAVCAHFQSTSQLDRWLADGFYEVATAVPGWTAHPDFPRPAPAAYYEDCLERIGDLADWFFRGESSYGDGHVWADL